VVAACDAIVFVRGEIATTTNIGVNNGMSPTICTSNKASSVSSIPISSIPISNVLDIWRL
jgi:hypothetical protein